MNQDTNPTSASAIPAPKTLQIQSNEIEQLAYAVGRKRWKADDPGQFVLLDLEKITWLKQLPIPEEKWIHRFAMHRSGTLCQCQPDWENFEKSKWVIVSKGLENAMHEQPHTYGFSMMDAEMIAEHIANTCQKWLQCNFPADLAAEASRILSEEMGKKVFDQDKGKNEGGDIDSIALINQCAGFIQDSAVVVDSALKKSPRTAIRAESVAMIRKGAVQALMAAVALLEQSAALCLDARKSPPEGTARASSS